VISCFCSSDSSGRTDTDKDGAVDNHELKVAMRALGFDLKKAEVPKTLQDHDKMCHGPLEYDNFVKISCIVAPSSSPPSGWYMVFL
jgi:Ca2+-binding EF-hand superfamily protein